MDSFGTSQQQRANNSDTRTSPLTGVLINTISEIVRLTESCENYTCILQTYDCLHKPLVGPAPISSEPGSLRSTSESASQEKDEAATDQATLKNLDAILTILPALNELADCLKLVPISLVAKLFGCIHCLNGDYSMDTTQDECQLLANCWYHVLFIPLMDLLFCLIRLDRLVASMVQVNKCLRVFKKTSMVVVDFPVGKKNEENHKLNQLSREKLPKVFDAIDNIQSAVFSSEGIFERFLANFRLLVQDNLASNLSQSVTAIALSQAFEGFLSFFPSQMIDLSAPDSSSKPTNHLLSNLAAVRYMSTPSRRLLGSTLVFLLYCRTFEKAHNSVIKNMMNILHNYKGNNLVFLEKSKQTVSVGQLLSQYLPKPIVSSNSKIIRVLCQVNEYGKALERCEDFVCQTLSWQMQFKALFPEQKSDISHTDARSLIERQLMNLRSAIKLANNINEALGSYVVSNEQLTTCNMQVFQQIALIKSIGTSLESGQDNVQRVLDHRDKFIKQYLHNLTCSLKDRLMSLDSASIWDANEKHQSSSTLFTASILASRLSCDETTSPREQLLCLLELIQILGPEDLTHLKQTLNLMSGDIRVDLKRATNCSYMFWCLPSLGSFYRWALEEEPCAINELHYIHLALDDMKELFHWTGEDDIEGLAELSSNRDEFFAGLREELVAELKSNFLDRISQELETELRLQVHRKLQLPDSHNSFKRHVYNLKHIFELAPDHSTHFRLLGEQVSLRGHVEEYLNRIFQELTTITPHDWSTYDSMIHLARRRYGLQLAELHSSAGCLEGTLLDLLDVARNLGSFVARYAYDHPLRRFVEKWAPTSNRWSAGCSNVSSNHLPDIDTCSVNVLQLEHVQRCIQTHGLQAMSGPVNRSYQLIKKLLGLFSRQMSDERVVLALAKEEVALREDNVIDFERASALTNLFINSSSNPSARTNNHLKALRLSVTQLGNVLAFVGLLRVGSLRSAATSLNHLPDLQASSVASLIGGPIEFSAATHLGVRAAAANLDECLASLMHHFSLTYDYLSAIVHLFAASLQQPQQQAHLSTFFLLVPSLCIEYVNHLTGCKERLEARAGPARAGAQLTDDGFPLGVAFLLVALDQRRQFARLQWFEQVSQRMQRERLQLERRAHDKSSRDESLKQTALMSLRRINKLAGEYEALGYTLAAALFSFFSASALECPPPAR